MSLFLGLLLLLRIKWVTTIASSTSSYYACLLCDIIKFGKFLWMDPPKSHFNQVVEIVLRRMKLANLIFHISFDYIEIVYTQIVSVVQVWQIVKHFKELKHGADGYFNLFNFGTAHVSSILFYFRFFFQPHDIPTVQ